MQEITLQFGSSFKLCSRGRDSGSFLRKNIGLEKLEFANVLVQMPEGSPGLTPWTVGLSYLEISCGRRTIYCIRLQINMSVCLSVCLAADKCITGKTWALWWEISYSKGEFDNFNPNVPSAEKTLTVSVNMSVSLSGVSVHMSVCVSIYLSVSVCLSPQLSVCLLVMTFSWWLSSLPESVTCRQLLGIHSSKNLNCW